jgi:hypothetical protein
VNLKPIIFVSCGQRTKEEKNLGMKVCKLVEAIVTTCKAYFAENQNSLQGLTTNILDALDKSVGLIVIMHPRGEITFLDGGKQTRGSVWIEQEIAISAFMTQVLGRNLPVAGYVHSKIAREGMREHVLLNAKSFSTSQDVLKHLRDVLRKWRRLAVIPPPTARIGRELKWLQSSMRDAFFESNIDPPDLFSAQYPVIDGWILRSPRSVQLAIPDQKSMERIVDDILTSELGLKSKAYRERRSFLLVHRLKQEDPRHPEKRFAHQNCLPRRVTVSPGKPETRASKNE